MQVSSSETGPFPAPRAVRRREFIQLLVVGTGAVAVFAAFSFAFKDTILVRPPGSLAEKSFDAVCIRCRACAQVCPTRAIVLATLHDGFGKVGTPKVDPLRGPCERIQGRCEQGALCAQICPTGAIRQTDGRGTKMGSAVIRTDECIAWRGGSCLVCYEVCPVPAVISLSDANAPIFDLEGCIGCGRCVYACPAQPKALTLTPLGELRFPIG